jgi:hypothetical protein
MDYFLCQLGQIGEVVERVSALPVDHSTRVQAGECIVALVSRVLQLGSKGVNARGCIVAQIVALGSQIARLNDETANLLKKDVRSFAH